MRIYSFVSRTTCRACLLGLLLLSAPVTAGAEQASVDTSLSALSLEQLMDIQVTSVSKKKEKQSHTSAAVTVITQDEIRRSGATCVAEVLRLVPGLEVARLDAGTWAISARGFNDRFANKLLIMCDGRILYSPLIGGVLHWHLVDLPLECIDRIEVIRGPGGAVWGANAVDGVINIITKPAADTQGGVASVRAGTEERAEGTLSYSGKASDATYYRVFAMGRYRDSSKTLGPEEGSNDVTNGLFGFRTDTALSQSDRLTFEGDFRPYNEDLTQIVPSKVFSIPTQETFFTQGNHADLLGRWNHAFTETHDLQLQFFVDRAKYEYAYSSASTTIYDIEYQEHLDPEGLHDFLWGAGVRLMHFTNGDTPYVKAEHDAANQAVFNAFLQDELKFFDDRMRFSLGAKLEYSDCGHFSVQPNARVSYDVTPDSTVWASVSRSVAAPSLWQRELQADGPLAPLVRSRLRGGDSLDDESMVAYEAGYRTALTGRLHLDVAVFRNEYDRVMTPKAGLPILELLPFPRVVLPFTWANTTEATNSGIEIAAEYRPVSRLRLRGTYSYLDYDRQFNGRGLDIQTLTGYRFDPRHQAGLQIGVDVSPTVEVDALLRYVDRLPSADVDEYVNLDLRLGWHPHHNLELTLALQNLLSPSHKEFAPTLIQAPLTEIERGAYLEAKWQF